MKVNIDSIFTIDNEVFVGKYIITNINYLAPVFTITLEEIPYIDTNIYEKINFTNTFIGFVRKKGN